MKFAYTIIFLSIASIILYSCLESELSKGERLSKTYCGSCHLFPEPSLLDKKTWENGIMPKMAFRMGLDNSEFYSISDKDFDVVLKTIPQNPLVSMDEWDLIKSYYNQKSPDSIETNSFQAQLINQFTVSTWSKSETSYPWATLIQADTSKKNIWLGLRSAKLYKLDYELKLIDSISISSPASQLIFMKDKSDLLLQMGNMDPNDQAIGSLTTLDSKTILIDSLKRPVHLVEQDFNRDELNDFVICSFGNYTGDLSVYKNLDNNQFQKITLTNLPGARKTIVEDFDGDGQADIMSLLTQGDEQVQLYINLGNFKFRLITLLRFPPVYGSSYLEVVDFDKDGRKDILVSSGDNADFSNILKPYHGIRIYINQGSLDFKEEFFYPFPGASQTIAEDFDLDGDIDIAAISFFPDFSKPESAFVYLENTGDGLSFKSFYTPLAKDARWLRMEKVDLDNDSDTDIILAALNFEDGVPKELREAWRKKNTWLLTLRNNTKE